MTSHRPTSDPMNSQDAQSRLIALYLPQFHPIPENDEWWGKGFTEWTNTAKAKPLFPGHYQPHVPADLGFYDLRVPETREAQAQMARTYGIEAFCYYHYWFGGRRLLQRPFDEVLQSGRPDFPFCLCWANQSWSGVWHGAPNRILMQQTYPGPDDHRSHFNAILPALRDARYLTVDGKPLFLIYRPLEIPDVNRAMEQWRSMAVASGLKGLHIVGFDTDEHPGWVPQAYGLDATVRSRLVSLKPWLTWRHPVAKVSQLMGQRLLERTGRVSAAAYRPSVYNYADVWEQIVPQGTPGIESYPCVIPNWDNTPRSGRAGVVMHDSSPELFRLQFRRALQSMANVPRERNLVFLKSWNEWAEGNHLEPDLRFGHGYLQVIREEMGARAALGNANRPVSDARALTAA